MSRTIRLARLDRSDSSESSEIPESLESSEIPESSESPESSEIPESSDRSVSFKLIPTQKGKVNNAIFKDDNKQFFKNSNDTEENTEDPDDPDKANTYYRVIIDKYIQLFNEMWNYEETGYPYNDVNNEDNPYWYKIPEATNTFYKWKTKIENNENFTTPNKLKLVPDNGKLYSLEQRDNHNCLQDHHYLIHLDEIKSEIFNITTFVDSLGKFDHYVEYDNKKLIKELTRYIKAFQILNDAIHERYKDINYNTKKEYEAAMKELKDYKKELFQKIFEIKETKENGKKISFKEHIERILKEEYKKIPGVENKEISIPRKKGFVRTVKNMLLGKKNTSNKFILRKATSGGRNKTKKHRK